MVIAALTSQWQQISISLSREQVCRLLKALDHSVYFDSGSQSKGRFDILTGAPLSIYKEAPLYNPSSKGKKEETTNQVIPPEYNHLPFICGEIGFMSYDWGRDRVISVKQTVKEDSNRNDIIFPKYFSAYYSWSYIFDHKESQGLLTFSPRCTEELRAQILNLIQSSDTEKAEGTNNSNVSTNTASSNWRINQSFEAYAEQFKQALDYIYAGDCYQVNLAQRFEAQLSEEITQFYFRTRAKTNTHYACYMSFDSKQTLLSFSPEQFISIQNRKILTRPIKGTIANSQDLSPSELANSTKNKAENLMIVDLLRNDLSKVCKTHSVNTVDLFKLETYKNVHHLVSTIEGELKESISEKEAFLECFPGGSITGAPKKRAMEIIEELERYDRSAYCGSVYYLNDNGEFDSNILIRSIVHSEDKLYCWGGGGIVADSEVESEYQESITKVQNLFDHLETDNSSNSSD